MALIKCPECGKEISDQAAACPNCGYLMHGGGNASQKKKRKHGCLFSILIFIIMLSVGVLIASNLSDGIQKDLSGVNSEDEYITLEEYNKIESGMTYDEVVEIVGSGGTQSATSTVGGYTSSVYTWYGNGSAGSNATISFMNGKVNGKAQIGLE